MADATTRGGYSPHYGEVAPPGFEAVPSSPAGRLIAASLEAGCFKRRCKSAAVPAAALPRDRGSGQRWP